MILVVKNLHVYYSLIEVVRGIDFKIKAGHIVSLIGSNGAEKTSALDALLNVVKRAGEIGSLGYDTKGHLTHTLVQKGIALVPERRRVSVNFSVEENSKIGVYNNSENYEHLRKRMYRSFPRPASKKHAMAGNLSGGEAQMLAISRALTSEPKLLVLGESSLGLVPKIVGEVFGVIVRLKKEGITILLVEQNTYPALKVSNCTYVLGDGLIAVQGEAKKLVGDDNIRKKYLGS